MKRFNKIHILIVIKQTIIMTRNNIFSKLWDDYIEQNPAVLKVYNTFTKLGEDVKNDHIAFRTFNDKRMDIDVLAKPFLLAGYKLKGEYYFEEKKLIAKHYEVPGENSEPRVFISQLILEEFSKDLQNIIAERLNKVDNSIYKKKDLIFAGNIWETPSYKVYHQLREESEYAAWLYVFGFRANHFTVSINHLKHLSTIKKVNEHIKSEGFSLNSSGGEIKGEKKDLLQQSSILAENISFEFKEGIYEIPGCYYEFAIRYADSNGDLFSGFLAKSANKIFESTDFKNK